MVGAAGALHAPRSRRLAAWGALALVPLLAWRSVAADSEAYRFGIGPPTSLHAIHEGEIGRATVRTLRLEELLRRFAGNHDRPIGIEDDFLGDASENGLPDR